LPRDFLPSTRVNVAIEGLSVVVISYYVVSLGVYFLAPFAQPAGMDKSWTFAALTTIVLVIVWMMIRTIRKSE